MLAYPHLNMEWLLIGKGKMYKEATTTPAPVPPAQEQIPTMTDLLYGEYDIEEQQIESSQESQIAVAVPDPEQSNQSSIDINTSRETTQVTVKQRKVSKIIIMYDDGSYQEM